MECETLDKGFSTCTLFIFKELVLSLDKEAFIKTSRSDDQFINDSLLLYFRSTGQGVKVK